jgi:hypothetical protein
LQLQTHVCVTENWRIDDDNRSQKRDEGFYVDWNSAQTLRPKPQIWKADSRRSPLIVSVNLSRFRHNENIHIEYMSWNDVNTDGWRVPCKVA